MSPPAPPSHLRRALLRALASTSALSVAGVGMAATAPAAKSSPIADFSDVTMAMTGFPVPSPDALARMNKAFATPARRSQLAALARVVAAHPGDGLEAALKASGLTTFANELTAAWFSGIVNGLKGQQVVLYTDAYVWQAMTFSKPMGECGGALGYWSTPPA